MGKDDKYMHDLFFGSYSIPARLNMLNYHIQNNPKYAYLKKNFLLQQLYFDEVPQDVMINGNKAEQPVFLKLSDNLDGSRTSTDLVADAWLDMLNDKDENVANFAKDLVMYAYLTSGSFSGWNKLAKYIPYEFISGQVDSNFNLGKYIKDTLDNNSWDIDEKSIILNLGTKSGVIKKIGDKKAKFFDKKAKNVLLLSTDSPREMIIKNINGVDRYFQLYYHSQNSGTAIYLLVKPKGFHTRQGDIYEHYFDLGYKANDVKINKISQLNALINLGLDAKVTAYDGKIEVGDIVMDSKTFIAEEYDYMSGQVQVQEKNNIKQFNNTAQVYTYYKLLAYGYLDYAKDVLDNPDKTVTYQMWLESPQVQSVLTEKQVQTWDSIKDDVWNHIIRYDSQGNKYTLQDEQLSKETESPNQDKYVNHSGGAVGSDSYWGTIGEKYGVVSEHYYYGNKTPNGNHQITQEQFEEGKEHVLKANETLHRRPDAYMNLLSRNYAQVKNADAIFAVGHLKNGIVDGGTGWAVQMAIDDNKPVYVYDQTRKQWFSNINGQWQVFSGIPKLTKNFAGIGTRELNQDGKDAIKQVYENTFNDEQMFDDSKFDQSNMDHCKK